MKIAIISDTHDNLKNLEKFLSWLKKEKISVLIHCGDICHKDTLLKISQSFEGKIYIVFGNADAKTERDLIFNLVRENPKIKLSEKWGEVKLTGGNIAFTHYPEQAKTLAQSKKYNFVFFGHTHKPWEEKIDQCSLVNPGNLANLYYPATFAVLDLENNKLELKILEKLPAKNL